jgi:hypothetical protein
MLIAQGLGEYGALSGGASSGIANLIDNVEYTIRDAGPGTWAAIFLSVLFVWFFFLRAR